MGSIKMPLNSVQKRMSFDMCLIGFPENKIEYRVSQFQRDNR